MKRLMPSKPTLLCMLIIAASISHTAHAASNGNFQTFLDTLRAFESGIDPAKSALYAQNLDNPSFATYAKVTSPGHIVRDLKTGSMISEPTSARQFFTKLGVIDLYSTNPPDPAAMFRAMQYKSLNAWGFVGYQLGEGVMISAGYYSPKMVQVGTENLESYYIYTPDSTWANGVHEARTEIPGSGGHFVLATDVNRWEGTFTGKNGVNSYQDLVLPDKQELAIRDAMRFNYGVMTDLIGKANMTWAQVLAKSWPGKDAQGNPIQIKATMSGILAAAHLTGAWGAADLLTKDTITCDETGTCNTTYVQKFGGFDTTFDTPGDDIITGNIYDDTLTAGQGNDTVYIGGSKAVIQLNQFAGGKTTIKDFVIGKNRIILRNWSIANPLSNLTVADGPTGAVLTFGGQSVVLENVTASAINANIPAVIAVSHLFPLAWSGTSVAANFDPTLDQIQGTSGIDFKNLKIFQEGNSLFVGTQAADGGIYSWVELPGVTRAQVTPNMFTGISGGFDKIEYTVLLKSTNWGWGVAKSVDYFQAANTTLNLSAFPYTFGNLKLAKDGNNTILSLADSYAAGDTKKLTLLNTNLSDLSAKNFFGLKGGTFADIQIDNAIQYAVTASVQGTGGTISPSGTVQVKEKTNQVFAITPNSGYQIDTILVDGVSVPVTGSYTLTNVTAAHSIVASFKVGQSNTCTAPAWVSTQVYTGGNTVSYQGSEYQAKWWSQGNIPTAGDPWLKTKTCQ
ncbi:carbohydrate-binding protein [Andreprevotia chitinilytica]|uniref:carbohydrate-binding protein n=1 Tax=Andreprevotia chitinilytica TaxID=396808 RepID=UPI001B802EB6|nr:carbohydrate-binding protein [Andreprevotia chitinilytica]